MKRNGKKCNSDNFEKIDYSQRFRLSIVIIKFRYNARADWLKQRALSEYRCTESRCHAISPFVKCLSEFSLGFFYPDVLYNQENEKELLASMDIDHPVRNSTHNTVIESEVSEEVSDENTEPSRKI